jgi:hypothetical protein
MAISEEKNTDIVLKFNGTTKIEFIKIRTNEKSVLTINKDNFSLSLNSIYNIPISNTELNMTESNCLSPIGKINERIEVLNVEDGIAVVMPRVHGVFVSSGDILGKLI